MIVFKPIPKDLSKDIIEWSEKESNKLNEEFGQLEVIDISQQLDKLIAGAYYQQVDARAIPKFRMVFLNFNINDTSAIAGQAINMFYIPSKYKPVNTARTHLGTPAGGQLWADSNRNIIAYPRENTQILRGQIFWFY